MGNKLLVQKSFVSEWVVRSRMGWYNTKVIRVSEVSALLAFEVEWSYFCEPVRFND